MPAHLTPLTRPTGDALITGDPRRAFALAQALTIQPKMSHQARGLWGYVGETEGGLGLTVQSTGAGGPAAIAVIGDLGGLGVGRLVRIGTCLSAPGAHEPGDALLVERSIVAGGPESGPDAADAVDPCQGLMSLLAGVADPATVSSHDFVSRFDPDGPGPAGGATARDLQTAAVLGFSRQIGLEAAAVLVVSGKTGGTTLGESDLEQPFNALGRRVVERLESGRHSTSS